MKLNIHILSHPIIQSLSNTIIIKQLTSNLINQRLKELGLFIIYETTRNWLKIYNLKIKQITQEKEISIIDPKESYMIIFNNLKHLSLFQETQILLPKVTLKLIDNHDLNIKNKVLIKIPEINLSTKIIITCYEIEIEYINNLLNYLTKENNININQIRLTCIQCTTDQLVILSKKHAKLNIYTTKIIKN